MRSWVYLWSMAESVLNFDCNWQQALNTKPNTKATVGYLLDWAGCGGLKLQRDIEVLNPAGSDSRTVATADQIQCIGLLASFRYEGGTNDPIRIACYLSKGMAAEVQALTAGPIQSTKLKVSWLVLDYDEERKQWYEAAFCKSPKQAEANVDSAEGELQLDVDCGGTNVSDALNLRLYRFEFQVVPADKKVSELQFATGPTRKLVRKWAGQ